MSADNILEKISEVTEFNDIKEFMNDQELDAALEAIIKIIAKPDIPPAAASILIIKLQAISAKLAVLARYYTTLEKGEVASKKKNVYYTVSDSLDKLVAALKYGTK
jgi:hypothetical protein